MQYLYTFGIYFYGFIIRIASLFNEKAALFVKGRKNVIESIPNLKNEEVIWFHCASLGEFDQGLPLMFEIKKQQPSVFILVTFFSPSGKEHYHKRVHPADFVCYLPLDTPSNAQAFLDKINPTKAFFVKYEFWANYILNCSKKEIPVYSVSTLLRPTHRFFKWYGGFFRKILKHISFFYVQNEESCRLLTSIGIHSFLEVGDARFDRVIQNRLNAKSDVVLEQFCPTKDAFIIGSSWDDDEALLEVLVKIKSPKTKIIIAPHNIDEGHLKRIEKHFEPLMRYTNYQHDEEHRILLIDCIGKLSNAYQYGKIAYVGGGFSGSLHNILEPATFGLPVLFGPKHKRFPEAEQFIQTGIGISVSTPEELLVAYEKFEQDISTYRSKAIDFVEKSKGSSLKIYKHVFKD